MDKKKTTLNRIWVPHGNVKKIAQAFECTPQMVNGALAGRKSSELAIKIRHVAITQYGGKEIK